MGRREAVSGSLVDEDGNNVGIYIAGLDQLNWYKRRHLATSFKFTIPSDSVGVDDADSSTRGPCQKC